MPSLLSINNYYYYRGGAETVFLRHNELFAQHGWNVVPFSMQHPQNLPTPWARYFIEELELGAPYSLGEKLVRVPKALYSFEARRKLSQLIAAAPVDICHAHNVYHHLSPSILGLLKQRGLPVVLTLHDLKLACPAYNMLARDGICERCKGGRVYNVLLHRCIKGSVALSAVVMAEALLHQALGSYRKHVDRFVVPSRFYIRKFAEWGLPVDHFRHVPNFVDVARHVPQYMPGDAFIYVGRVSREKGIATLIRAASAARSRLEIAGTGPQLEEMRALATELNADVTFLGYLDSEALAAAVSRARALVLASECYENAPMSVLEAYALGKPVIGARIGGIPELIRENETGISFESGDVEALAQALRTITARSSAEIEAMGRAARQWVAEEFSAAAYLRRIREVYAELGVTDAGASLAGNS